MKVYHEKEISRKVLQGKILAVIGYGSRGHAQANNLKESGRSAVVVLGKGGGSRVKARKAGRAVFNALTGESGNRPLEEVGGRLCGMMPRQSQEKLADHEKN